MKRFGWLGVAGVMAITWGCSSSDTKKPTAATDGGTTNAPAPTTTATTPPPDPQPGWRAAVGAGGVIVQTFDERAWETRSAAPHDLYGVACVGNALGWAVGPGGAIAHTTDGGRTWRAQQSGTRETLRAALVRPRSGRPRETRAPSR